MEGLTSAVALVSVAIQLADSLKKLSDFWESLEAAPTEVQTMIADLDLLRIVLLEIASEADAPDLAPSSVTLEKVLRSCGHRVQELGAILDQLQPGFDSRKCMVRKWTAFKSTLKWEKIWNFQTTLDRLKVTLMLVLENSNSRANRLQIQQQRALLATSKENSSYLGIRQERDVILNGKKDNFSPVEPIISNSRDEPLVKERCSELSLDLTGSRADIGLPTNGSVRHSFFGTASIRSTRRLLRLNSLNKDDKWPEYPQYESQTSILIRPAKWLKFFGLATGFHFDFSNSSTHGWKHTLSSFRMVPDNAPIFKFCQEGNVAAVRTLLSTGNASAQDTDTRGLTPLHTDWLKRTVIRMLKGKFRISCEEMSSSGNRTDSPIPNVFKSTPFHMACLNIKGKSSTGTMNTIRQFLDLVDFSDECGNGWSMIINVLWDLTATNFKVLRWIMPYVSQEIRNQPTGSRYINGLYIIRRYTKANSPIWLPDCTILNILSSAIIDSYRKRVIQALEYGANPRSIAWATLASPLPESPMSLSMYSKLTFDEWNATLSKLGLCITSMFDKELLEGPLRVAGWTRGPIERVINWKAESPCSEDRICMLCCEPHQVLVQPVWIYALEEIKKGVHPDDTIWSFLGQKQWKVFDRLRKEERLGNVRRDSNGCISVNESLLLSMRQTFLTWNKAFTAPQTSDRDLEKNHESVLKCYSPDAGFHSFPFEKCDLLCMPHWLEYLEIKGGRDAGKDEQDLLVSKSEADAWQESDFSPFLIHS